MMGRLIKLFGAGALCAAVFVPYGAMSQPRIVASITPDSVGVGDPMTLTVDVEHDMMQMIAFPDFDIERDKLLEQVTPPVLDTLSSDGRRVRIRRSYTFRSFEPGLYNIGKVSVLCMDKNKVDTLYGDDSVRFMIGTFLIDSTSHAIFDLKPQRNLPFKFEEISTYAMWGGFALVLLIIAIIIFLRVMAKLGRPVMGLFKPKPPVLPHVAAFKALETLREEQLWQSGEYKGYYSRLTDILRTYISGRYGVAAMEMTSVEIIAASRELELPRRCEMELQELLRDADLVKFAKAEFSAELNEKYYETTRLFVDLTKPEEAEPAEETVETEEKKPEQSEKTLETEEVESPKSAE